MKRLAILGGEPACKDPFPRWPQWGEAEKKQLERALETGYWGLGSTVISEWESRFAEIQRVPRAVSVANGTVSLVIALRALGVRSGDEVIIPAYTFTATASAVLWAGAVPVFCDICPGSLNMDPEAARGLITDKTRAIIPVHVAGCPADMSAFRELAKEFNLALIEDAAQAHGSMWEGQGVGALGDIGSFSFQSSKNLSCGEGGMLVTSDEELWEKCEKIKNCGRPPEGSTGSFETTGINARLSAFQAAVLLAQAEQFEERFEQREKNWAFLGEALSDVPGIALQKRDPRVNRHALHLLILDYDSEAFGGLPRSLFLKALEAEGVPAPHGGYQPIYKNPAFLADVEFYLNGQAVPEYRDLELPQTERVSRERSVWIRQNALLGETTRIVEAIADAVHKIHSQAGELMKARL